MSTTSQSGAGVEPGLKIERVEELQTRYAMHAPRDWGGVVLVAVHGVARSWRKIAREFLPAAARAHAVLIVPHFSKRRHRGYQRLQQGPYGLRSDQILDGVLHHAARRLRVSELPRIRAFGFSGGGQFLQRYSLQNPERVARQVLCAPGYYTMPDPRAPYPYGTKPSIGAWGELTLRTAGFLVPTRVFVGERDTVRDPDLRVNDVVDERQGLHRLDRAESYVAGVRALANFLGSEPTCTKQILKDCGHSFVECNRRANLVDRACQFLLEDLQSTAGAFVEEREPKR